MDVHSNAAVSSNLVEDFLPCENMEGGDGVSLEWLSIFVEDCLNGGFSTQPLPTPTPTTHQTPNNSQPQQQQQQSPNPSLTQKGPTVSASVPSKARTKRRKINHHHQNNSLHTFHVSVNNTPSDSPLLPQTYWLADSELIFPKKENENGQRPQLKQQEEEEEEVKMVVKNIDEGQGPRRCTHCGSYKTPQWRAGPLGPKTLCNACGVRFKSGRLLPEYRPAKSPTFESFKHSNSHKKVMEMRMMATSILSSNTN